MNKVIGLINAWSCDTFIEPAMLQAVEYCDEVIVSVGYHSEEVKQFEDNTLSIVNEFVDHDNVFWWYSLRIKNTYFKCNVTS